MRKALFAFLLLGGGSMLGGLVSVRSPTGERVVAPRADSLALARQRELASAIRGKLMLYLEEIRADTISHEDATLVIEEVCRLSLRQKELLFASGQNDEVLVQVPISQDSLAVLGRKVASHIALNLQWIFDLPEEEDRPGELCELYLDNSISLMERILQNLRWAQVPYDSLALRGKLLRHLQQEVSQLRREVSQFMKTDGTILRSVCEWEFLPEELGLKMEEIPNCHRARATPSADRPIVSL